MKPTARGPAIMPASVIERQRPMNRPESLRGAKSVLNIMFIPLPRPLPRPIIAEIQGNKGES